MAGIRARRRPRVRSVNFRRLRWVLVREAAFRIFFPHGSTHGNVRAYRHPFAVTDTDKVIRHAELLLVMHPERRMWPPSTR